MGHGHLLSATGDKGNIKRHRHAKLAFLKIDMRHQDPRSRAPKVARCRRVCVGGEVSEGVCRCSEVRRRGGVVEALAV